MSTCDLESMYRRTPGQPIQGVAVPALPLAPWVGRLEDLPYSSSPPIQFVYESTAAVAAGTYTWADVPTALTIVRPIMENALYLLRNISFTANVAEADYTANITTVPQFGIYSQLENSVQVYREQFRVNKFYDQFDYRLLWGTQQAGNQLLATFTGVMTQGINLIGKASITLKAVISAQEIVDEAFIAKVRARYPQE